MFRIGLIVVAILGGIVSNERTSSPLPVKPKAASQNTTTVFQGTVTIVTNSQLVLTTRTDRRTFVVPANALIVVNRAEATLYDIVPGQFASVASSNSNGQLVANFIHAFRQY